MNKPVAWLNGNEICPEIGYEATITREHPKDLGWIPLYTHPVKEQELLDEIEALKKQVVIWERSSKDRAIKLNICAIKVSELEKKLDTRTKELIGASFYEHDYKTMMANNKPVAYWDGKHFASKDKSSLADIPLYTHPVKEQELLDEITKLRWKINHLEIDIDSLRTTLFDIRQKYDTENKHYVYTQVYVDELQAKIEALQSHPVKELTDEEIMKLWKGNVESCGWNAVLDFARAILRKAQEK